MASFSNISDIRLQPRLCNCGRIAALRIVKTNENGNEWRMFFVCPSRYSKTPTPHCNYFKFVDEDDEAVTSRIRSNCTACDGITVQDFDDRQRGTDLWRCRSLQWRGDWPLDVQRLISVVARTHARKLLQGEDLHSKKNKVLVKELAQTLERQFAGYAESRAVDMLLLQAIDTFNVNVVLVLGQEKLCSMLKDVLKSKPDVDVDVVKLQKSGGVVSRNSKVRQKSRSYRIREYFYGVVNDLSHIQILQISVICLASCRPNKLVPVNINRDNLLHLVLAVSFAKEPEQIISRYANSLPFLFSYVMIIQQEEALGTIDLVAINSFFVADGVTQLGIHIAQYSRYCHLPILLFKTVNVAGFIYITDINIHRKKITYLAPSARQLPSRFLIMGTLTWLET
ncbi:hypothetical protein ACSBR2_027889 [Camellia fascicularis]